MKTNSVHDKQSDVKMNSTGTRRWHWASGPLATAGGDQQCQVPGRTTPVPEGPGRRAPRRTSCLRVGAGCSPGPSSVAPRVRVAGPQRPPRSTPTLALISSEKWLQYYSPQQRMGEGSARLSDWGGAEHLKVGVHSVRNRPPGAQRLRAAPRGTPSTDPEVDQLSLHRQSH